MCVPKASSGLTFNWQFFQQNIPRRSGKCRRTTHARYAIHARVEAYKKHNFIIQSLQHDRQNLHNISSNKQAIMTWRFKAPWQRKVTWVERFPVTEVEGTSQSPWIHCNTLLHVNIPLGYDAISRFGDTCLDHIQLSLAKNRIFHMSSAIETGLIRGNTSQLASAHNGKFRRFVSAQAYQMTI